MKRRAKFLSAACGAIAAAALLPLPAGAAETQWKPDRRIEIIVPSSTGGGNDRIGRLMQSIIQKERLVDVVTTVVNKPGAGMALGMAYLNQHPGDAHYLLITSVGFLTNHITGRSPYSHRDVTPAMASAAGNHNHLALAAVTRQVGGDVKKLKVVAYGSGGKAMTAMLGGHVDLVVAPAATLLPQLQQGLLRMIAITAPKRQEGAFAAVPTWREQGVNVVLSNWRVILAPKGVTPQQAAYWENVLARVVATNEWKEMLEQNVVTPHFMRSSETRKYLDEEYGEMKATLDALGLVKQQQ